MSLSKKLPLNNTKFSMYPTPILLRFWRQENYGRKDKECEARVKVVFNELKLDQAYYEYEERVVGDLKKKIAAVDESRGLKAEVFTSFLNKIYKRSK